MEKPILTTGRFSGYNFTFLVVSFSGVFFFLIFLILGSISHVIVDQTGSFVIVGFIIAFIIGIFVFITNKKIYEIFPEKINVLSFWGKPVGILEKSQIKYWTEDEVRIKGGKCYILSLYLEDKKIVTIKSLSVDIDDYNTLKEILTKNIPEDKDLEIEHKMKGVNSSRNFFFAISLVLVLSIIKTYYSGLNDLSNGQFSNFTVHITKSSSIEYRSKGSDYLYIYSDQNPNGLEIEDYTFYAMAARSFVKDIHPGDTVYLEMVKSIPANFWQTVFGSNEEYLCEVKTSQYIYLDFKNFSSERKSSNYLIEMILAFFMVFCLCLATYSMYTVRKLRNNFKNGSQ